MKRFVCVFLMSAFLAAPVFAQESDAPECSKDSKSVELAKAKLQNIKTLLSGISGHESMILPIAMQYADMYMPVKMAQSLVDSRHGQPLSMEEVSNMLNSMMAMDPLVEKVAPDYLKKLNDPETHNKICAGEIDPSRLLIDMVNQAKPRKPESVSQAPAKNLPAAPVSTQPQPAPAPAEAPAAGDAR